MHSRSVTIKWTEDEIAEFNKIVQSDHNYESRFRNLSEVIRYLANLGKRTHEFQVLSFNKGKAWWIAAENRMIEVNTKAISEHFQEIRTVERMDEILTELHEIREQKYNQNIPV